MTILLSSVQQPRGASVVKPGEGNLGVGVDESLLIDATRALTRMLALELAMGLFPGFPTPSAGLARQTFSRVKRERYIAEIAAWEHDRNATHTKANSKRPRQTQTSIPFNLTESEE